MQYFLRIGNHGLLACKAIHTIYIYICFFRPPGTSEVPSSLIMAFTIVPSLPRCPSRMSQARRVLGSGYPTVPPLMQTKTLDEWRIVSFFVSGQLDEIIRNLYYGCFQE